MTCVLAGGYSQVSLAQEAKSSKLTQFVNPRIGTGGATFEDVKLMKEVVGNKAQVKASGGVKNFKTVKKYIELCRFSQFFSIFATLLCFITNNLIYSIIP